MIKLQTEIGKAKEHITNAYAECGSLAELKEVNKDLIHFLTSVYNDEYMLRGSDK